MSIKLPKIHLDSGDPEETRRTKGLIGVLDGQTTNPSLVVKNPEIQKYMASGKKLTEKELFSHYKTIVSEIEKQIAGPISVEISANWDSKPQDMLKQAEDITTWGRNIYVKFPTIPAGVAAASEFVKKGGRVNMTLVFDQTQAAGVYSGTRETTSPVFISPFIGRLDDRGFSGIDLIKNILKMYRKFAQIEKTSKNFSHSNCHVQVLAASIRSLDHFYACIASGADILTVPYNVLKEWVQEEKWIPDDYYRMPATGLKNILYEDLTFSPEYQKYEIQKLNGSLLDEGLNKFNKDWNSLIG